MTGLDKMISQILEEADAAASQKEADAASRAEAILSEAEKEAEILKTEIEEKSEKELAGYESRHRLADEQKRRTALLWRSRRLFPIQSKRHIRNSARWRQKPILK